MPAKNISVIFSWSSYQLRNGGVMELYYWHIEI